jgi:hypothetical protein
MATIFCDPSAGGSNNGTSWENAYTSFQAAIDAVPATADELWVKARTITLSSPIDYDNSENPQIYGGFDVGLTGTAGSVAGRAAGSRTTISGGTTVKQGNLTRSCTLDGFVFSGSDDVAGGLQANYAAGTWTLRNCIFEYLRDEYRGGAILLTTGTLDIDNCEFNHNGVYSGSLLLYGGGIYMVAGTITCDNTIFHGNVVRYSGAHYGQSAGTSTFTNCIFYAGSTTVGAYAEGGGIRLIGGTSNYINCKIKDTSCVAGGNNWGGGINFNGVTAGKMVNCVVSGNNGGYGGGILVSGCTVYFTNCTVANNTATNAGGGIRNRTGGTAHISNCIFWGNTCATDPQISHAGTAIYVYYSDISGGYTGAGNVNDDPHFLGGAGADPFNFGTTTSNAIDSAASEGIANYSTTDILGQARVDYSTVTNTGTGTPAYVDMGAYEMQEAAPPSTTTATLLLLFN